MFMFGKIVGSILISPAIFIIILFVTGISLNRYNTKNIRKAIFLLVAAFYLASIRPSIDLLGGVIENRVAPAKAEELMEGDAYVLLGGGIVEGTPLGDIPKEAATPRILKSATLYKKYPKKIYVTGGIVSSQRISESSVYKKTLLDLGIPEKDIVIEERSRTTSENAKYTAELLKKNMVKKVVLITSASHMNRGELSFEKYGFTVIPAPCGYLSSRVKYEMLDFIPRGDNIGYFMRIMWEYAGLLSYKLKGAI